MKKILLPLFALLLLASCANDAEKKVEVQANPDSIVNLPPLPEDKRLELYRKTIAIDIIAYEMGISMSYNDPASVQPVMAMIKPAQGTWKKGCKPVGRISFMFDTGIGQEAEMLIHDGCKSFVWLKDGKNAYINDLTDEGLEFFTRYMPEDPSQLQIPEGAQPKQK